MPREKRHIKYWCKEDIERWLIISGDMAQAEKGSTRSFYGSYYAMSDWHFDLALRDSTAQERRLVCNCIWSLNWDFYWSGAEQSELAGDGSTESTISQVVRGSEE